MYKRQVIDAGLNGLALRKMLQVQDDALILTPDGEEIMQFYAQSIAPLLVDFDGDSPD